MKKNKKLLITAGIILAVLCSTLLILLCNPNKYSFNSVLRKCGFGWYIGAFKKGEPKYHHSSWSNSVQKNDDTPLFSGSIERNSKSRVTSSKIHIEKDGHKFQGCTFYIFSSRKEAKEAFKSGQSLFKEVKESGSKYIYGSLNAYDVNANTFFYLTRNMIVEYTDYEPFAGWLEPTDAEYEQWEEENYSEKAVEKRKKENEKMHKKIKRSW